MTEDLGHLKIELAIRLGVTFGIRRAEVGLGKFGIGNHASWIQPAV
jgi:hypothetical protein